MFEKDFFILLQAGLNQRSTETLSAAPDWDDIYTLASQQTVQGIVADGISVCLSDFNQMRTVPKQFESILDRFQYDTVSIIRRNAEINALQSNITRLLTDNNIKHLIVKGQEAARNYPKPNLRSAGDIDILLPAGDYERAKPLLHSIADSELNEQQYRLHKGYLFGDIEIELHGTLHTHLGRRVNHVLDRVQCDLFNDTISLQTFHHLYLFVHALQHFCHGGIGIRQLVDWEMNHIKHKDDIDFSRVDSYVRKMHLTREWNNFLTFANELTSSNDFSQLSRIIWDECKLRGNMGCNLRYQKRKGGFILRNTRTLLSLFTRFHRNRQVIPTARFHELKKDIIYYTSLCSK